MSEIKRRNFLTFLGSLPVVSDWMKVLASTHARSAAQRPVDEEFEAKFLAVETLRLINTAEKWHFSAANEHVSIEQLHQTESYKKLIEVAGKGRFKRVVPKLPEDGRVELPGYDIFVEPNTDRSKYVARVSMNGPKYIFAFASDEIGGIYEGVPLHAGPAAASEGIDALVANKRPMGRKAESEPEPRGRSLFAMISLPRIPRFLRVLLQLPPGTDGCHCCACTFSCSCCSLHCGCFSTCPTGSQCTDYCCFNCGCIDCNCIWCRSSNCPMFCPCGGDCSGDCDDCEGTSEIDCSCLF